MREEITRLAQEAGKVAMAYFEGAASPDVEQKGHLDLVTRADRDVEKFLVSALHERYPEDGIFGEEGSTINPGAARQWVIDPIDGTFNFVRKMDQWAVSIGLFENGKPTFGVIHTPARGETLSGGRNADILFNGRKLERLAPLDRSRGVISLGFSTDTPVESELEILRVILQDLKLSYRNCGSTTVAFMMLATGQVDAVLGLGVRSWDIMAGLALVEPLGGKTSIDWSTTGLDAKLRYISGSPELVDHIAPVLARSV